MKLYKTDTTSNPFEVRVTHLENGLSLKVLGYMGGSQHMPEDAPLSELQSLTIDKQFIVKNIGAKAFVEATHVYIRIDATTGALTAVRNKLADTWVDKGTGSTYMANARDILLAQVYIPFADTPESDWVIRINCNPNLENQLPGVLGTVGWTPQEMHDFALKVYPSVLVDDPQAQPDGGELISVHLTDNLGAPLAKQGVRIFAKASAGYVNKSEAYTDQQGRAIFKARRLDLESADQMVVEFGFKFLSNVGSVHVPAR
jgi:hypothetical protein